MIGPSYLGAYWGARRETSARSGERLAACIAGLSEIDDAFGQWFRRVASKAAAKKPVDLASVSLGSLMAAGVNRRDHGREVIEELGFSFGLWNGARPTVGMSGTVGAYSSTPGLLNSFVLDFPAKAEADRIYEPSVASAIFDAVVSAWEPDWATWTSHALREAQRPSPRTPVIGWKTYVTPPIERGVPDFSSRALLRGTVIDAATDAGAVRESVVLDLRQRLTKARVLRPI